MSIAPDPSSHAPSAAYRRYLFGMIVVVMMLATVDRYVVSILVDDIKLDLGLDDEQMGWILGPSFTVVYALSVLPLARWADRGVRRIGRLDLQRGGFRRRRRRALRGRLLLPRSR